jgi:hypothetical protein
MRTLIRVHRYLSCVAAPLMLFFAVSGAWQAFRLHESRKDGSYQAPPVLSRLSDVHKVERLGGAGGTAFKVSVVAVAAVFACTAVVGVVMAFRVTRPRWIALLLLLAGAIVPVLLLWTAEAPPPRRFEGGERGRASGQAPVVPPER